MGLQGKETCSIPSDVKKGGIVIELSQTEKGRSIEILLNFIRMTKRQVVTKFITSKRKV